MSDVGYESGQVGPCRNKERNKTNKDTLEFLSNPEITTHSSCPTLPCGTLFLEVGTTQP